MKPLRWYLYLPLALLAGFGLGLLYAWLFAPVQYVETTPETLRSDYKDQYRLNVAAAYAATGNLPRAQSRLDLLGEPDAVQGLSAQAQRVLAEGQPPENARSLALLAAAIQNAQLGSPAAPPTPALASILSETPAPAAATGPGAAGSAVPTRTPPPVQQPTRRPTATPSPTPGAAFVLVEQETVCDPALPDGLLQVTVSDKALKPVPGVELVITWKGGEEHFFTGLKPELGNGYADFSMTPETVYSLRLAVSGAPLTDLSAPACQLEGGGTYWGGLRLQFRQP